MKIYEKVYGLAKSFVTEVRTYWKRPPKNNYVCYKELLNYSIGGMGNCTLLYMLGFFALGAGNLLLGSAIGIRPMHLQTMAVVSMVVNVLFYIIRGKLVDSTRTKYGRFRPWMAMSSVPLLALSIVFIFLPFDRMAYTTKFIYVFVFAMAVSLIQPLFTDTYSEMRTVISPNSKERTKVISISSIIYSLAPSIYNLFIPILSGLTGGFTDIRTYRYVVVPVGIIGMFLSFFAVCGCKERVVTSKTYVAKTSTFKDIRQIWRNKYWWIRTLAGLITFLEGAFLVMFNWMFVYGSQNMTLLGIFNTILGSAGLIAMVITPFIMEKLGNRRLLLLHNIVNVILIIIIMLTFKNMYVFFALFYLNTIINSLTIVYEPSLQSEVKDYQQYISDKRMDFTFGAAGQIFVPLTILTGYIIPFVYEMMGVTTNYDIMYDPRIRNQLFFILCIMSIVGATLNLVPYFFYRLSRQKHQKIITVLQFRSVLEDIYSKEEVSPYRIKYLIEGVNEINAIKALPTPNLKDFRLAKKQARALPIDSAEKVVVKKALLEAKAMPKNTYSEKRRREQAVADAKTLAVSKIARKQAIKLARKNFQLAQNCLEDKEGIKEIWEAELIKYDTPFAKAQLALYSKLLEYTPEQVGNISLDIFNCPSGEGDKKIRTFFKKFCKSFVKMQKNIKKHFPNGVVVPDKKRFANALDMPSKTKEEIKTRAIEVQAAKKESNTYTSALEPYIIAYTKLLKYNSSKIYDEVASHYDEVIVETERLDKESEALQEKENAEHKAYTAQLRKEKFDKLPQKKQNKIVAKRNAKQAKRDEKQRKREE